MERAESKPGRSRLLMRGESVIASTGLAMAAILLVAFAGAGAWTVHSQRMADRVKARETLRGLCDLLARGVEPLLADGELSSARTIIMDTAARHGMAECRVRLPDGTVVADAEAKANTLKALPAVWPTGESGVAKFDETINILRMVQPLTVSGRGVATLELASPVRYSLLAGWEAQTGLGLIGACGAIAVLAVYRRLRIKLRALGAIREALVAIGGGESAGDALAVSAAFGEEAAAWNGLIQEREQLRKDLATERARESIGPRRDLKADLANACDALSQGLILVDESLTIKYANGAAAVFLRAKRETLAGGSIQEHFKSAEVLESLRSMAGGGARRRTTLEITRPEAEGGGVLRVSIRPVRKDDTAAALVTIEDVTQQRVADEARNAFVAQATHELRTPLTNIRLYVEQAIESGDDRAVQVRALDVINQESRRLERIVGDMLSVSEIEAGSFRLRTGDVRLETLFDDLKAEYEAQARERKLSLTLSLPPKLPVLQGDRDKIVLALHNLIGNALKYTPEGGKIHVKVESDEQRLQVEVADSGIGISAEETDLIFEKFYRAKDKRVAGITGTGLGLALAREVVRMHGGDIAVRSQLDQGSTFTLTLPLRAEAA